MYQSFPQRRICSSNSAMPVIKPQMNKNFCEEKKKNLEKTEKIEKTEKRDDLCNFSENNNSINCKEEEKCDEEKKQECSEEKSLCPCECSDDCNKKPLGSFFGDLFKNIEIDDLILIGLILFLLYEGEDNIITIGILALVLFL